jgi:hypothetical protein
MMARVPNGGISSKASSQPKSASCTGTTCQQPAGHHRGAAARTWLQPTDASWLSPLRAGHVELPDRNSGRQKD